jgi:prepilin peptidase CpaA
VLAAATLVLFPVLMVFAAFSDLFTMTISNRISIGLVIGFPILALAAGMPLAEIGWHLACALAVLSVTFTFFAFGWIGGGDAKLASATALWLGWEELADYGVLAALLGGALTLAILQMRRWPLPGWVLAPAFMSRLADRANGVPYGIALAVAGLVLYPDTHLWLDVASR